MRAVVIGAIEPTAACALDQLEGGWAEAFPKLAAYPFPLFDYEAEDRVLEEMRSASAA